MLVGSLLYALPWIYYSYFSTVSVQGNGGGGREGEGEAVRVLCAVVFLSACGQVLMEVMCDCMAVHRAKFEGVAATATTTTTADATEAGHGQMQATLYSCRFAGNVVGAVLGTFLSSPSSDGSHQSGLNFARVCLLYGSFPLAVILPSIATLQERYPLALVDHLHEVSRQQMLFMQLQQPSAGVGKCSSKGGSSSSNGRFQGAPSHLENGQGGKSSAHFSFSDTDIRRSSSSSNNNSTDDRLHITDYGMAETLSTPHLIALDPMLSLTPQYDNHGNRTIGKRNITNRNRSRSSSSGSEDCNDDAKKITYRMDFSVQAAQRYEYGYGTYNILYMSLHMSVSDFPKLLRSLTLLPLYYYTTILQATLLSLAGLALARISSLAPW